MRVTTPQPGPSPLQRLRAVRRSQRLPAAPAGEGPGGRAGGPGAPAPCGVGELAWGRSRATEPKDQRGPPWVYRERVMPDPNPSFFCFLVFPAQKQLEKNRSGINKNKITPTNINAQSSWERDFKGGSQEPGAQAPTSLTRTLAPQQLGSRSGCTLTDRCPRPGGTGSGPPAPYRAPGADHHGLSRLRARLPQGPAALPRLRGAPAPAGTAAQREPQRVPGAGASALRGADRLADRPP